MKHKRPIAVEDTDPFHQPTQSQSQGHPENDDFLINQELLDFCHWSSSLIAGYGTNGQYGVNVNDNTTRNLAYENTAFGNTAYGNTAYGNTACGYQHQYQNQNHIAQTITVDSIVPKIRPSSSIRFFYPAKSSNKRFKYSMESNAIPDEHEFIRPDESTKIPNSSKSGALSNVTNSFRYVPEDSCDSVISVDDADDDDDDDEANETPGKSLNRLFQGPSPARGPKSQEPSAVEELQALMLSVRESSGCAKENQDKLQDEQKTCKVESSMDVDVQKDKNSVTVPNLEMVEEPEESYRARYESEGCRGPIRGVNENGFPTVRVNGYTGNVLMTVFLVTECGEPHLHSITGPGSTKTVCKEVTLEGNVSAIQTLIGPEQNMTAVWDSLSVRRIRNWDADKKLRERGDNPAAWKTKKKEARLMFQCAIPQTTERPGYILTCQSRPFMCTAPSGNPEIWWISESDSLPKGGREIGIIGKKFSTGFRVRFYGTDSEGFWESYAEVDKSKSHQGAIVLKIPPYKNLDIDKKVEVLVEVRVGPEKDKRCSESIAFCYKPDEPMTSQGQAPCSYCNSVKNALSHLFGKESKVLQEPDNSDGIISEPESKRPSPNIEELIIKRKISDQGQKASLQSKSIAPSASFDGDVLMSDLSKKTTEQQHKNIEKNVEVTSVDHVTFPGTVTGSMSSANLPSSTLTSVSNSSMLNFLLQNQAVTANATTIGLTSAASNPSAIGSAMPGLPASVSIPSQADVPVQVYTSPFLSTNQLIGSTQTKSHAATVGLSTTNIAFLPTNLAKVSQPQVQLCILNNQPSVQQGNILTSAAMISSSIPAQNISSVQLSNPAMTTNGNVAPSLGSLKGQEYYIIGGLPAVNIKEEESQKACDLKQNANINAHPQIGSSWSLSYKPQMASSSDGSIASLTTGLVYQTPQLINSSSGPGTVFLVSQGHSTPVPISKPTIGSMLASYSQMPGVQHQATNVQPQMHAQQQPQQPQQQQPRMENSASIAPVNNPLQGSMAQSVTRLPSTVHATPISGFANSMMLPQNLVSGSMQAQNSSNINTSDVTLNLLQPTLNHERTQASSMHASQYMVQYSLVQQPATGHQHQTYSSQANLNQMNTNVSLNNQQQLFNSMLSNAVTPNTSSTPASFQQTVSSFESVGINTSVQQSTPFQNPASFGFSSTSNEMPNNTGTYSSTAFTDTVRNQEKQVNSGEVEKLGDNVLANDLNRLSVVGGYMQQSAQILSEARDIPMNTNRFTSGFSSMPSAMNDPQPMSLTDDTLAADLSDLIKEPTRSDVTNAQFSNDQTRLINSIGENKSFANTTGIDHQGQGFSSEQQQQLKQQQLQQEQLQQQQLADSFLVPQEQDSRVASDAFIVGEDIMIGGNSFADIDKGPKSSTEWAQTVHTTNTNNANSAMISSNWAEQTNLNQNQSIAHEVPTSSIVNEANNAGYPNTYAVQQSTSATYDVTSGGSFLSNDPAPVRESASPQQQFTVQNNEIQHEESDGGQMHHMTQERRQGGGAVSQNSSESFSRAQDHTVISLANQVSQQRQDFFNDQSFVNNIVNGIAGTQQCYNDSSAKLGTIYNADTSSAGQNQMGLQSHLDVLHQTSLSVDGNMVHQSVNESLASHSSPHVIAASAVNSDQSDQSKVKQELFEDLEIFLAKGMLSQREAHALYKCINQDDNLLFEMYRSSRRDGGRVNELIETLKHWVKHVS